MKRYKTNLLLYSRTSLDLDKIYDRCRELVVNEGSAVMSRAEFRANKEIKCSWHSEQLACSPPCFSPKGFGVEAN